MEERRAGNLGTSWRLLFVSPWRAVAHPKTCKTLWVPWFMFGGLWRCQPAFRDRKRGEYNFLWSTVSRSAGMKQVSEKHNATCVTPVQRKNSPLHLPPLFLAVIYNNNNNNNIASSQLYSSPTKLFQLVRSGVNLCSEETQLKKLFWSCWQSSKGRRRRFLSKITPWTGSTLLVSANSPFQRLTSWWVSYIGYANKHRVIIKKSNSKNTKSNCILIFNSGGPAYPNITP